MAAAGGGGEVPPPPTQQPLERVDVDEDDKYCDGLEVGSLANIAPTLALIATNKLEVDRLMAKAAPELRRKAEWVIVCAMRLLEDVDAVDVPDVDPVVRDLQDEVVAAFVAAKKLLVEEHNMIVADIKIFGTDLKMNSTEAEKRLAELYIVMDAAVRASGGALDEPFSVTAKKFVETTMELKTMAQSEEKTRKEKELAVLNDLIRTATLGETAKAVLTIQRELSDLRSHHISECVRIIDAELPNENFAFTLKRVYAEQLLSLAFLRTDRTMFNRELTKTVNENRGRIDSAIRLSRQTGVTFTMRDGSVHEIVDLLKKHGSVRSKLWNVRTFTYEDKLEEMSNLVWEAISLDGEVATAHAALQSALNVCRTAQSAAVQRLLQPTAKEQTAKLFADTYLGLGGNGPLQERIDLYNTKLNLWRAAVRAANLNDVIARDDNRWFATVKLHEALRSMHNVIEPDNTEKLPVGSRHPLVLSVVSMVARMVRVFECTSRRRLKDYFAFEVDAAERLAAVTLEDAMVALRLSGETGSRFKSVLYHLDTVLQQLPRVESISNDADTHEEKYARISDKAMERFSDLPHGYGGWQTVNAAPLVVSQIGIAYRDILVVKKDFPKSPLQYFGGVQSLDAPKAYSIRSLEEARDVLEQQRSNLWFAAKLLEAVYTIANKEDAQMELAEIKRNKTTLFKTISSLIPSDHDWKSQFDVVRMIDGLERQYELVVALAHATQQIQRLVDVHVAERTLVASFVNNSTTAVPLSVFSQKAGGGEATAVATISNAVRYFPDPMPQWTLAAGANPRVPETYFAWWLAHAITSLGTKMRHGPTQRIDAYNMHRVLLALMVRSAAAPYETRRKKDEGIATARSIKEEKDSVHRKTAQKETRAAVKFVPHEQFMHSAVLAERWFFGGVALSQTSTKMVGSSRVSAMPLVLKKHETSIRRVVSNPLTGASFSWSSHKLGGYFPRPSNIEPPLETHRLTRELIGFSVSKYMQLVAPGGQRARILHPYMYDAEKSRYFWDTSFSVDPTRGRPHEKGYMARAQNAIVDPTKNGERSWIVADSVFEDESLLSTQLKDKGWLANREDGANLIASYIGMKSKLEEAHVSHSNHWLPSAEDAATIQLFQKIASSAKWDRRLKIAHAEKAKLLTELSEELKVQNIMIDGLLKKTRDLDEQSIRVAITAYNDIANRVFSLKRETVSQTQFASFEKGDGWGEEKDSFDCLTHVPTRGISILDDFPPRATKILDRKRMGWIFIGQNTLTATNENESFVLRQYDLTKTTPLSRFQIACVPRIGGINASSWHNELGSISNSKFHSRSVVIRGGHHPIVPGMDQKSNKLPVECGHAGDISIVWPGQDRIGQMAWRSVGSSDRCKKDSIGWSFPNSAVDHLLSVWRNTNTTSVMTVPNAEPPKVEPMFVRDNLKESKAVYCTIDRLFHLAAPEIARVDPVAVVLEKKDPILVTRNEIAYATPGVQQSKDMAQKKIDESAHEPILGKMFFKKAFSAGEVSDVLGFWSTFPRVPKAHAMSMIRTPMPRVPLHGPLAPKVYNSWKNTLLQRALPLDDTAGSAKATVAMSHHMPLSAEEAKSAFRCKVSPSLRPIVDTNMRQAKTEIQVPEKAPEGTRGLFGSHAPKNVVPFGIVPGKVVSDTTEELFLDKAYLAASMFEWCGGAPLEAATLSKPLVLNHFGHRPPHAWTAGLSAVASLATAPPPKQMQMAFSLSFAYWKKQKPFAIPMNGLRTFDVTKETLVMPIAPGGGDGFLVSYKGSLSIMPSATLLFCGDEVQETKIDFVDPRDGLLFAPLQQFAALAWSLGKTTNVLPQSMIGSLKGILDTHAATGGVDVTSHAQLLEKLRPVTALAIDCVSVVLSAALVMEGLFFLLALENFDEAGLDLYEFESRAKRCVQVTTSAAEAWRRSGYEQVVTAVLALKAPQMEFWDDSSHAEAMIDASEGARQVYARFQQISKSLASIDIVSVKKQMAPGFDDSWQTAVDAIRSFVSYGVVWWGATCKLSASNWSDTREEKTHPRNELDFLAMEEVRTFVEATGVFVAMFRRDLHKMSQIKPLVSDDTDTRLFDTALTNAAKRAEAAARRLNIRQLRPQSEPRAPQQMIPTKTWFRKIREAYAARDSIRKRSCLTVSHIQRHGEHTKIIDVSHTPSDEVGIAPECFFVPIWHPEHERTRKFVDLLVAEDNKIEKKFISEMFTPKQAQRLYSLLVLDDTPHATIWRALYRVGFETLSTVQTVSVVPQHTYRIKSGGVELTLFANPYMYAPLQTVAERAVLHKDGADLL